jgi:AcrR family transcriptional regulator
MLFVTGTPTPDEPSPPTPDEERTQTGLVWTRLPKEKRERPTREAIVATAIRLADTEGLDAVSIRRVAAALETRPMGLYSHIARKDDLIDLMVDEVLAEALLEDVPDRWRDALSALAHALRAACLAHPWLVTAAGQRPDIGPNAMRCFEQALEAISDLDVERTKKLAIVRAVTTYAMGHAQVGLARGQFRESLSDREWRTSAAAYLERLVDSGEFPHLAAFGAEGLLPDENDKPTFETGLDWLLTGIATDANEIAARNDAPR